MRLSRWLILLGAAALLVWGYSCYVERIGVLKGEIAARGKSIEQLSELAAKRKVVYLTAKKAYLAKPSLETCSVALLTCEQMDSTNKALIGQQQQQIHDLKKLNNRSKLFGFLPKPVLGVGIAWCPAKAPACLFGGIPITR